MEPVDWHALDSKERIELALRSTGPFFVTGEDSLQLSAIPNDTTYTITLAGRFMQLDGQVTPFSFTLRAPNARVLNSAATSLGNGWILNFAVLVTTGSPQFGNVWVRVNVLRGDGGATTLVGTLASGYVTAMQPIAFPVSRPAGPLDGAGWTRVYVGSVPAAGAEISEVVASGAVWDVIAVFATLTTSAAAANRVPALLLDDGANVFYRQQTNTNQTASLVWTNTWSQGVQIAGGLSVNTQQGPLPVNLRMMAGWRIRTSTTNIDAGDQWSAPKFLVVERMLAA